MPRTHSNTDPSALVQLSDAAVYYGRRLALDDITLSARAGELVYLTGRSGAGKTTLLRLINGEVRLRRGLGWVAGTPLHSRRRTRVRRRVGVVFQDYSLVASMTAFENVEFAYRVAHVWESGRVARARAWAALADVGLADRIRSFPAELSGGEQQRVAIARAVVSQPDVLLADEPTGNLDEESSAGVLALLEQAAERGALVLLATHDLGLLRRGRRHLHIEEGRLVNPERLRAWAS